MKWKRFFLIALTVISTTFFAGCWDQREFSDLAVVMGITVDLNDGDSDGTLSVGVQVANPVPYSGSSGEGASKESYSEFSDTGNNIFEILRSVTHVSSRRLYNSHNQIVVFGNELAKKEGIGGEMDFFLRDNEMRYSVLLAVSEGKASEILAADTNYEHVPAKELAELIRNQATNSGSVECNLLDFVRDATAEGSTCLVPVVRIKEEPLAAGGEESGEKASKSAKGEEGGEKKFEVNGSAVFKGDIMVGQLDERETRGALWVRDKVDRGIIEASFDGVDTEIEVFECKTFTSVKINDKGEVSVDIRCEIYANIAGLSGYEGLLNKELTEKIRNSAAAAVKEEILSAWEKSKEMECDVFCLGNKVYKKTPDLWRKYQQSWQKMYNETTFNFNIDINIEDVGDLTGEVQWKGVDDKK